MKRNILLYILFTICHISTIAQQFQVERVEACPMDLTASVHRRTDLNNDACALVKFEIASPNAKFEGNVVGDISYEAGQYLVYVSKGTKLLKVLHENLLPLSINFGDYGIKSLESSYTYVVTLTIPLKEMPQKSDGARTKYVYTFRDEVTGYYGLKNALDEIVVDAIYEGTELYNDDGYIVVVRNDKVGIINSYGKQLLPCEYDFGMNLGEKLISCARNGEWGIVDYENNIKVPFEYEDIDIYGGSHESRIAGLKKNDKYALFDLENFHPKSDFIFDKIESGRLLYDNGIIMVYNPAQSKLFAVKKGGKWGFVNEKCDYVIAPQFDDVDYRNRIFVNGTAAVCKNGKFGIIDESGRTIAPFKYSEIYMTLNNAPNIFYCALDNEGYEIYSTSGDKITHRHYQELGACEDDMASFKENDKYGVIELKNGKEIIPAVYDDVHSYGFGEGKVMVKKDGKWGCINKDGTEVFGCYYDDVYGYSNGACRVKKDGKWGMKNSRGGMLVDCKYDEVTYMGKDRLAGVRIDGKWALVNILGKIVTPFQFDDVAYGVFERNGFTARKVRMTGKYGYVDFRGTIIIPCEYDENEAGSQLEKYIREMGI